jgi:SAM-dependent methyltransferase
MKRKNKLILLGNYGAITSIKDGFAITERNDGFIDPEYPQIYFYKYSEWLDVEKEVMKYVKGRTVLDIGCETGRHALYLNEKKQGFGVLGIDTSPLAIKLCKLQGSRKAEVQSITQFTLKQRRIKTTLLIQSLCLEITLVYLEALEEQDGCSRDFIK